MRETIRKLIPSFLLDFYHYLLAGIGAFLYGFPSKKIKIIGVTGTSGKSTVVNLTTKILEEAGYKVACLSSIKFKIGNKEWENTLKMTMPGRMKLQRFLKQAVKEKCQYLVLEVTSEGIKQYRHKFIDFEAAVFTNLSPEHIEAHKGFENYRKAKLKLFKKAKKVHIVNLDDENVNYFLDYSVEEKWGYRVKRKAQSVKRKTIAQSVKVLEAENIQIKPNSVNFIIKDIQFNINLLGEFNIYNSLSAICVGLSQGVSLEICKKALEKVKGIPGRMEIVIKEPFTVIVDYAHTPEALKKVYETIKSSVSNSMICVLGSCGGGRDKWKRSILGKLAAKYCNKIIITNEDPYDEEPLKIMKEIASDHLSSKTYQLILDRREAIRQALKIARPNDVIIITGKGSEPWMCIEKGKKIPWDDRQIVREEFQKLNK